MQPAIVEIESTAIGIELAPARFLLIRGFPAGSGRRRIYLAIIAAYFIGQPAIFPVSAISRMTRLISTGSRRPDAQINHAAVAFSRDAMCSNMAATFARRRPADTLPPALRPRHRSSRSQRFVAALPVFLEDVFCRKSKGIFLADVSAVLVNNRQPVGVGVLGKTDIGRPGFYHVTKARQVRRGRLGTVGKQPGRPVVYGRNFTAELGQQLFRNTPPAVDAIQNDLVFAAIVFVSNRRTLVMALHRFHWGHGP
jgi:hypothetical protein